MSRASHPHRPLHLTLVISLLASLLALAAAVAGPAAAASPFGDVPGGAFYADAVEWLGDETITTGTSPTTFSPNDAVTRGQMAAFLERYAQVDGTPGEHGFADVAGGAFYDGSVSFLVAREITTGTSPTRYSPDDNVTRAQMATFLWRFSSEPTAEAAMPFIDVAAGTYYYEAVRWLAEKGITTGTTPTTYSPNDTVTRGQMATFLWRLAGSPNQGTVGANRIDTEKTTVVEEGDLDSGTEINVTGESTLEFVNAADVPDPGDVVVMGITDETPEGFIGMVDAVDGDIATTSPATLQQALPEADFASTFDFDDQSSSGLSTSAVDDKFKGVTATCGSGAQIDVDVDFGLDAGIDVEASWDPFGDGVEAYVGFNATASASATVTASGKVECEAVASVDGPKLNPITFWLGPVPVVLIPQISFEAVLAGSFEASASVSAGYNQTVGAGLRFENGRWSTEYTNSRTVTPPTVNFAAQLTASLDLRARLDLKVYGAAGPYLTLGPFIEFNAQNTIPWWNLDAGVRASIGASIDVFFFKDEVEFAEIELLRFRLADSGESIPPGGIEWLQGVPLESVDAYGANSCGVNVVGSVYCTGDNFYGQIGDGSSGGSQDIATVVADVNTNLLSDSDDAIKVGTGGTHACALIQNGTVKCWGNNQWGELGDGTFNNSPTPVPVVGITNAIDIAVGSRNSCAILADHTLRCWGFNDNGQLGDGTTDDASSPVTVQGLDIVVDVTIGNSFVCAVRATGDVWCWGYGYGGELGNGTSGVDAAVNPLPVQVLGLDGIAQVESNNLHTCARDNTGAVSCWGAGGQYQLGNGTTQSSAVPIDVQGLGPVTDIAVGARHSCGLKSDGTLFCWGYDAQGQVGNGTDGHINIDNQPAPVQVHNLDNFTSVVGGGDHTCGTSAGGKAYCWGHNNYGELGDGDKGTQKHAPLSPIRNI